ncbi:MAG: hypothetical protein CR971_01230 [candidate division SR1 bacterium]|nr:MAG: hypothetical protein CR971_01230 [candidate division SR1 bacterium]
MKQYLKFMNLNKYRNRNEYLSEIYAYDKLYIEVTNLSQTESFSGMITLSGTLQNQNNLAQNISQSVTLQPQQQIIFYTDPSIFENISQFSGIQADFSFLLDGVSSSGNAHGLQLNLLYSGNILDTFTVHNDRVQKLSGDFTSFEKIGSGIDPQNYITTYIGLNLDRVYNIKTPYLGNPGKLFTTAENSKDITQPIPDAPIPSTGLQLPINCNDFRNPNQLTISEIFPGNQTYHPFIEIENPGNIAESYEYLFLSGTALSGSLYYQTTNLEHNKMLLFTDTDARYNEGLDAVANADFALQNSGWITVYGMNYVYDDDRNIVDMEQDILDVVYYSGFTTNKSLYYNTHDVQCGRIFDEALNFSPTFDDKLLQFFSVQSEPIVKTVYVGGGGGGCSYDRQTRFDPAPEQNTDPVEIKTIKYHSPELQQITLKSKSKEDINLRNYRLQTLNSLKYYSLKSRTLFAGQDKIMTGNFSLPKQDSCVNLLKDDVVIDRYCYARLSTLKIKNLEENQEKTDEETDIVIQSESEESINGLSYLTITNIDYNPKGVDIDNERLYFAQNISQLFLDQANGNERKKSDFALDIYKNNQLYKTKKFTDSTITQHGNKYLQGDFQLPNNNPSKQDIIVNLRYHQQVIARGSYNPYQDKNTFKAGEYLVSSVLDGDTFRIKHNGKTQSVRLLGVDAPESSIVRFGKAECFGKDAKKYLKSLINKKMVTLIPDSTTNSRDKFGRRLAYVYLGDISDENFINRQLLINGYAKEYTYQQTNYTQQGNFKTLMQTAKNSKLGMWSDVCLQHDQENQDDEKSKETQENTVILSGSEESIGATDIKIQHINYNPEGKDKNRETITLLSTTSLITDKNFHLLINDRKKSLPRSSLQSGKNITITGNFQFPNSKPTCVKLQYQDYTFDTYCYNPNDAQLDTAIGTGTILTGQKNTELERLSVADLKILQTTKLKRFDDQTCLLYNKQKITCIKTPKIKKNTKKTSSKKSKKSKKTKTKYKTIKPEAVQQIETELKYYKKFVQVLKSHLQDKRYPFYNQELKSYFTQLKTDKTNKVYDTATIHNYFEKPQKTLLDTRIQKNILEKIPAERKEKYWSLYDVYMEELNRQAEEI